MSLILTYLLISWLYVNTNVHGLVTYPTHFTLTEVVTRLNTSEKTGTGYFYLPHADHIFTNTGSTVPVSVVLVTNKHMIVSIDQRKKPDNFKVKYYRQPNGFYSQKSITLWLDKTDLQSKRNQPSHKFHDNVRQPFHLKLNKRRVMCHPTWQVDLCLIAIPRSVTDGIVISAFNRSHIPNRYNDLESCMEDIKMIGYPGFIETAINQSKAGHKHHYQPIHRHGITSTCYHERWGGLDEGLVDVGMFGGFSGSPIISSHRKYYHMNGTYTMNWVRLLGTASSSADDLRVASILTETQYGPESLHGFSARMAVPSHLGVYVKSHLIEEILNLHRHPNPQSDDVHVFIEDGPDGYPRCNTKESWQ